MKTEINFINSDDASTTGSSWEDDIKQDNHIVPNPSKSPPFMIHTQPRKTSEAKEVLTSLLVESGGDLRRPEVKRALQDLAGMEGRHGDIGRDIIQQLSRANSKWYANWGRWKCITMPPFPGDFTPEVIDVDGKEKVGLGSLSFGMFKPDLLCVVEEVDVVIKPIDMWDRQIQQGRGNIPQWAQTYNVEVLINIEAPSTSVPAKLTMHGVYYPVSSTRVALKFFKGSLEPGFDMGSSENGGLACAWKDLFENAHAKESESRNFLHRIGNNIVNGFMAVAVGLEPPVDSLDLTQSFKINRGQVRSSEILYLDQDFHVSNHYGRLVAMKKLDDREGKIDSCEEIYSKRRKSSIQYGVGKDLLNDLLDAADNDIVPLKI